MYLLLLRPALAVAARHGLAVLDQLRGSAPHTRVVIETSCSREALKGRPVEAYLRKPFSLDELLSAIEGALRPVSSPAG